MQNSSPYGHLHTSSLPSCCTYSQGDSEIGRREEKRGGGRGEREERESKKLGHKSVTCMHLIFTSTTNLSPGSFIKMRSHQDGHLK